MLGNAGGFRSRFKLWDVATGKDITPKVQPFAGPIHQMALTPDGSAIALALGNGSVKLLDTATGAERISHHDPSKGGFYSLLISPDGRTLLSWSQGGPAALPGIHVWDTTTGQEGSAPAGHTAGLSTAAFSPDGAILATVDRSGLLLLSNRAGTEIRRVQMPGLVHNMIFAADGRHLVTANANGTIYILRIVPPAQ
jgi:WD40 repeat protein